jgi:hypothetical protein
MVFDDVDGGSPASLLVGAGDEDEDEDQDEDEDGDGDGDEDEDAEGRGGAMCWMGGTPTWRCLTGLLTTMNHDSVSPEVLVLRSTRFQCA